MSTSVAFKQKSLFRAVPGLFSQRRLFNPATPFDNVSVAQQTLEAILDELGGILWLPNQHNYTLTADTAVAESGDPVGYMGSHRQNLPENYVKNSMMVGASAGVLATNWSQASGAINGVTFTQTGAGTDADGAYQEWTASGTAGGTNGFWNTNPNGLATSTNHPAAALSQLWSMQAKVKQTVGTAKTFYTQITPHNGTTAGTAITSANTNCVVNAAVQAIATGVLASGASVDRAVGLVYVRVLTGSGDWTGDKFRIYAPQLERGKPTAFTPTYGEAITRGANFEPAWQDTTANKPLLGVDADGKGTLVYDGSNDFFRTGIQTPEAGYIAGVWNLTGAAGVAFGMFSSSSGAIAGARFIRSSLNVLGMFRHNGTISDTCATVETYLSGKAAVDAHFAAASASVRKNGSYEVSNTNAATATSINYFRIGASGAGGDAQTLFFNGHMLAQVWIPGARPGATVEAEIRRLLAEITAVSGVV